MGWLAPVKGLVICSMFEPPVATTTEMTICPSSFMRAPMGWTSSRMPRPNMASEPSTTESTSGDIDSGLK